MTDLSIHRKNIATYELCEKLIKFTIEELYNGKSRGIQSPHDYGEILNIYYEHLERVRQLKNDYLKQNNLRFV